MPAINRQLVETHDEHFQGWLCSHCGQQFLDSSCALAGLTIDQIVRHFTTMRDQAFAQHVCLSTSD
jgi:hypothetical protein